MRAISGGWGGWSRWGGAVTAHLALTQVSANDGFYTEDEGDDEHAAPIEFPPALPNVYFDDSLPCSVHKLNRLLWDNGSKFTQQVYGLATI